MEQLCKGGLLWNHGGDIGTGGKGACREFIIMRTSCMGQEGYFYCPVSFNGQCYLTTLQKVCREISG
jgi:hypothetical protein